MSSRGKGLVSLLGLALLALLALLAWLVARPAPSTVEGAAPDAASAGPTDPAGTSAAHAADGDRAEASGGVEGLPRAPGGGVAPGAESGPSPQAIDLGMRRGVGAGIAIPVPALVPAAEQAPEEAPDANAEGQPRAPSGGLRDRSGGELSAVAAQLNRELMPLVDECLEMARERSPEAEGLISLALDIVPGDPGQALIAAVRAQENHTVDDPELFVCLRESALSVEGLEEPRSVAMTIPFSPDGH
ncbi:MAG: hypothetical protein AAGH15_18410 [Myxococcota bacterium]